MAIHRCPSHVAIRAHHMWPSTSAHHRHPMWPSTGAHPQVPIHRCPSQAPHVTIHRCPSHVAIHKCPSQAPHVAIHRDLTQHSLLPTFKCAISNMIFLARSMAFVDRAPIARSELKIATKSKTHHLSLSMCFLLPLPPFHLH